MKLLYCRDCGSYLMAGDGECHDCHCGWKQPEDPPLELEDLLEERELIAISREWLEEVSIIIANSSDASKPMMKLFTQVQELLGYEGER